MDKKDLKHLKRSELIDLIDKVQSEDDVISKEEVKEEQARLNNRANYYAFGFSRLSTKYETTKPPAMRVVSKKCYTK